MELKECVKQLEPSMLKCLQENLRIPSVQGEPEPGMPYGSEVRRSLDHLLAAAEALGFLTVNMDGQLGWCEYGTGEEMVAVLGHLDVVPAGDDWSFDPWGGEIKDGRIFGRGTMDDKGPSVAALFALAALRDSGLPIRRRIRVLWGCNEESGSADMKYYLAHNGEIPVMGFTPDGEYPVINGEKGIINVTYEKKLDRVGDLQLISLYGGTAPNVVPSSACAKLSCSQELAQRLSKLQAPKLRYTATEYGLFVEAEGTSAHGSTPELGENAIGRLLLALDTLPLEGDTKNAIHFLAETLGMETDGTSAGIAISDEVSGKLTLNWGTLNIENGSLQMKINYRYPVTKSYDDCAPILDAKFAAAGFTKAAELHKAKLYVPEDSELVRTLMKVYREQTGLEGTPKSIGGGTYAKSLPNIVAFGPIFPGDEIREHKPDEFLELSRLMENTQIIAAAMYEMAK
ncbi:MAG: dipeptidase PepV [Eubacteriales bacterium]|nr:dipeptidase PepV [Eubacteriales bacterium]